MNADHAKPEKRRRRNYLGEYLDVFIGLKVSSEMNAALEREAERSGRRKADFTRLMIAEGLKSWAFRDLRVLKKDSA